MKIIIYLRSKAKERVLAYTGVNMMHSKVLTAEHFVIHMLVDWT
jgi:hypothetical protein